MKDTIRIVLTKEEYQTLLKINDRYYFGLFKSITSDENEEIKIRDSLDSIAMKIEKKS